MSLVLINGNVLALHGSPVDMQPTPSLLTAPTVNLISITAPNPGSPITATVQISNRDSDGTSIMLFFSVQGTGQSIFTVTVANANATVAPLLPAGYVLNGQTLVVRAVTKDATDSSNPSDPSSLVYTPSATGNSLPATLPFSL